MRRDSLINKFKVRTHFSLFEWNECEFCHSKFRREKVYRWVLLDNFYFYSCTTCSCSISHCNDNIQRDCDRAREKLFGTNPPLAPPMRTYNNSRR